MLSAFPVITSLEQIKFRPYRGGSPILARNLGITHDVAHFPVILKPNLSRELAKLAGVKFSLARVLEINRYIGYPIKEGEETRLTELATHNDRNVPYADKILYLVSLGEVQASFTPCNGTQPEERTLQSGSTTLFDAREMHSFITKGDQPRVCYSIPVGKRFSSV